MGDEPLTILVIDDHQVFAEALARALELEEGVDGVEVALTAEDGLAKVRRSHPSVALVDHRLGEGIDGVQVIRTLRDESPGTATVMLTAQTTDQVLLDAIDAGCSGFLTKDRPLDEVVAAVRAAASGDAVIAPDLLTRLLPRMRRGASGRGEELTERERDVLARIGQGKSNGAIAAELDLSVHTVRNHVANVLRKLGAHSKLEAMAIATERGLLQR